MEVQDLVMPENKCHSLSIPSTPPAKTNGVCYTRISLKGNLNIKIIKDSNGLQSNREKKKEIHVIIPKTNRK